MISYILLFSIHLFFQSDSDIASIRNVMAAQQEAWNKGDLELFMEGYWKSDSLKFIGSRGIQYGWNTTLANYKKSYPDRAAMGELTFTILSVEKLSAVSAFVVGKWQLKRSKDSPHGHFTLLWRKINNEWVIIVDHSS